ncbi:hypothetical protein Pint_22771 [Pistacia integerrima]|uniref:Uncharacterized protein n=2 Tax=Pistacia TaxID=55512 RepID=A0ACC1B6V4_9ROSI|nr:hypothetical protein Pint_22771 [Pistacia integerrima]KAJ0094626.1 hypothetical protein Patl1_15942 [Pistacia atlantica]
MEISCPSGSGSTFWAHEWDKHGTGWGNVQLVQYEREYRSEVGYDPGVECNMNASNTSQLYQIYLCIDTSGKNLVECPGLLDGGGNGRFQYHNICSLVGPETN